MCSSTSAAIFPVPIKAPVLPPRSGKMSIVVDSRNLSTGQGLLVLHGAEMAQRGCSAKEIYEECTKLAERVEASFVIDSVDYLYKGGRCSALAALGANIFNLKPCIEVKNGFMEPGKKYRGKIEKVVLDYVADQDAVNAQLEPSVPQETTYTVQPGDTLWGIAQTYGTTVAALANHNDIADPSLIYAGQEIRIPN